MKQATLMTSEDHENLPTSALSEYLQNAGEVLAKESALLGHTITQILTSDTQLTNKVIIAHLIMLLETTEDAETCEIIRNTLGIVVDHTIDDL